MHGDCTRIVVVAICKLIPYLTKPIRKPISYLTKLIGNLFPILMDHSHSYETPVFLIFQLFVSTGLQYLQYHGPFGSLDVPEHAK